MNIIHNNQPFFHISLENIFSEKEWSDIYQELILLKPHFKTPEHTESATHNKKFLKKNKGIFLLETKNIEESKIIPIVDNKIKDIKKSQWKVKALQRLFNCLMWGSDLINYYENNDYYMPHVDVGVFTLILWMWDKNLNFTGGDLYFPEHDYLHNCKNNHGIIFFSKELHGATTFKTNVLDDGRYSIVTFSSLPEGEVTGEKKYRENNLSSSKIHYQ